MQPKLNRVLLIELDGASYDLLTPLANARLMPYLAEFLESAALARLSPTLPCTEALTWTTFWTGSFPRVHGVLDDCRYDHRARRLLPVRAPAQGVPTLLDQITPESAAGCAVRVGGSGPVASFWNRRPENEQELDRGLRACDALLRRRLADVALAAASHDWRLLSVRIDVLDSLQHRAYNLLGHGDGPSGCSAWIARTQQALASLDRALGELFALAEQRRAAVMIVSPNGFAPFRERIHAAELLRRHELLQTANVGWGRALWRRMRNVGESVSRFVVPRRWRSDAIRPLQGSLRVDWANSRAVTLHGVAGAMIYLNTRERFGGRVLRTRRQLDRAATDVLWALEEARHPLTDEPLFQDAYLTAERFACDPLERNWPEIVAVPAAGYYTLPQLSHHPYLTSYDRFLTAARCGGGLWMVRAPGVEIGRPYHARLVDVSASIVDWLGAPRAQTMAGRPVTELFEPAVEPAIVSAPLSAAVV